jgi:hypothetical protein
MFFFFFIHRLKDGSHQKHGQTSVTESHMSDTSVTTLRRVHRKTGNDSDSSTEYAVENEQKVKGYVTK